MKTWLLSAAIAALLPFFTFSMEQERLRPLLSIETITQVVKDTCTLATLIELSKKIDIAPFLDTYTDSHRQLGHFIDFRALADFLICPDEEKKDTLKRCFRFDNWRIHFSNDYEHLITQLIEFITLEDDDSSFLKKIEEIKQLPFLHSPATAELINPQNIIQLLDLKDPQAVGPIFTQQALEQLPLHNLLVYNKLIILLACSARAGTVLPEQYRLLLQSITVDPLLTMIPQLGVDKNKIDALKKCLHRFQKGKQITKKMLHNCISQSWFSPLVNQAIDRYLNTENLITTLENYRDAQPASLKNTLNIEQIEDDLELPLRDIINTALPEEAQTAVVAETTNRFTNAQWLNQSKKLACITLIAFCLWASIYRSHSYLESILGIGVAGIAYSLMQVQTFQPTPVHNFIANTALTRITRMGAALEKYQHTPESILKSITQDDPQAELFKDFLRLVTEDQLKTLSHPLKIKELLDNPLAFIKKKEYADFIESLYTDKIGYMQRIDLLVQLLEGVDIDISYRTTYQAFCATLPAEVKAKLPTQPLLKLGLYHPEILFQCPDFIKALGNHANKTSWELFFKALNTAKN